MLTRRSTLIVLALLLAPFVLSGCGSDKTTSPVTQSYDTVPPAAPAMNDARTMSGEASIRWQKNTEADLAGYNVYEYAPSPDNENSYHLLNTQVLTNNGYMVAGLTPGSVYYFRVSAVDKAGNESALSRTIAVTVADGPTAGDNNPDISEIE